MHRRILPFLASSALVAGAFVAVADAPATAARSATVTMNSGTETRFVRGENVWLRGKGSAGKTVKVYRYNSKNRPVQIGTTRTSRSGSYSFMMRPTGTAKYRVKVGSTRTRTIRLTSVGSHSIGQRQASLRFILGSATSGTQGSGSVRWRTFKKGMLVQHGSRTWVIRGRAASEYRRNGGPTGRMGAPVGDARCGLVEGACLQKFRKGAIYTNSKAKDKTVAVSTSSANRSAIAAVALSQVGYKEPGYRKSKYNRWMGRTDAGAAWCAFFTAWVSYAAGEGDAIVRQNSFSKTYSAERKRGRTTSKPAVGRVAYVSTTGGTPHHAGIVIDYDSRSVWLAEGNVDARGGIGKPRGVHKVKRSRGQVKFYANPRF